MFIKWVEGAAPTEYHEYVENPLFGIEPDQGALLDTACVAQFYDVSGNSGSLVKVGYRTITNLENPACQPSNYNLADGGIYWANYSSPYVAEYWNNHYSGHSPPTTNIYSYYRYPELGDFGFGKTYTPDGWNPSITINEPNDTSVWNAGNTFEIRWTTQDTLGNLRIILLEGFNSIDEISPVPDTGSYSYTVPLDVDPGVDNFRIHMSFLTDFSVYDESEYFSITVIECEECFYGGNCYASGDAHPSNPCVVCNTDGPEAVWSNNDGADCDDGFWCNGADECSVGACVNVGPAVSCSDGVDCTDDTCKEFEDECENLPNNANCDDSVGCTDDACDAINGCQSTPSDGNCDDGVGCTEDTCDAINDCQFAPIHANCNDGVNCTDDICDAINDCQFTPSDGNCDDGVNCTNDTCDAINDCQHAPSAGNCNDGVNCTDDICDVLYDCQYTPNDDYCDDSVDCTDDICDTFNDCMFTPNDDHCDDSVGCTDDTCDAINDCQFTANDENCDDGFWCNGFETCDAIAACQAGVDPCPDDGEFCNGVESCEESIEEIIGVCVNLGIPCEASETCREDSDHCDPRHDNNQEDDLDDDIEPMGVRSVDESDDGCCGC